MVVESAIPELAKRPVGAQVAGPGPAKRHMVVESAIPELAKRPVGVVITELVQLFCKTLRERNESKPSSNSCMR